MSWIYGDPTKTDRPRCWGDPTKHDAETRECKGCTFRQSCRSEVINKLNAQSAPAYASYQFKPTPYASPQPAPQTQFRPAPPPVPTAAPAATALTAPQWMQRPAPAPAPTQMIPAHPQATAPVQVQSPMPSQAAVKPGGLLAYDCYGWLQDPLHYTIPATPPPMRVQMHGESFLERVGKNMLLATAETVLTQGLLAVRQAVLAPKPGQQ